jgi:hypothetical protein
MAEQWMSIVEYARTFKVSDMTVRRRIKTGRLHAVLKEGKYFIPIPVGESRGQAAVTGEAAPRYEADAHHAPEPPRHARAQSEMVVIKGHPAAHKTYATVPPALPVVTPPQTYDHRPSATFRAPEPASDFGIDGDGDAILPSSLRRPFATQDASLVDTRALLAFCEATLRKLSESERRQAERFKSKVEALEAQLANKDLELKQARQQLEDLQLLVSVLDGKKRSA